MGNQMTMGNRDRAGAQFLVCIVIVVMTSNKAIALPFPHVITKSTVMEDFWIHDVFVFNSYINAICKVPVSHHFEFIAANKTTKWGVELTIWHDKPMAR